MRSKGVVYDAGCVTGVTWRPDYTRRSRAASWRSSRPACTATRSGSAPGTPDGSPPQPRPPSARAWKCGSARNCGTSPPTRRCATSRGRPRPPRNCARGGRGSWCSAPGNELTLFMRGIVNGRTRSRRIPAIREAIKSGAGSGPLERVPGPGQRGRARGVPRPGQLRIAAVRATQLGHVRHHRRQPFWGSPSRTALPPEAGAAAELRQTGGDHRVRVLHLHRRRPVRPHGPGQHRPRHCSPAHAAADGKASSGRASRPSRNATRTCRPPACCASLNCSTQPGSTARSPTPSPPRSCSTATTRNTISLPNSFSLVKPYPGSKLGTTYPDMAWEPKKCFTAIADYYATR